MRVEDLGQNQAYWSHYRSLISTLPPARQSVRSFDVEILNKIVDLDTYSRRHVHNKSQQTLSKSTHVIWELDPILADADRLRSALSCTAVIVKFHHRMEASIEHPTIN